MAQAPTGPQLRIRQLELARELAAYLAAQGHGVYVNGAIAGNTIFLGRAPADVTNAITIVLDASPQVDPLSRLHFTLYVRDISSKHGMDRAELLRDALDRKTPPLPSYSVLCHADPPTLTYNANNVPLAAVGLSTEGVVRRA